MDTIKTETEVKEDGGMSLGTVYDINKQGYANILPYNEKDLMDKLQEVEEWFHNKEYCMLLCRERNDYTIFNFVEPNYSRAAKVNLKKCLKNRGLILDIRYDNTAEAYSIWLKIDKEVFMYYLFECRGFIVEVGKD